MWIYGANFKLKIRWIIANIIKFISKINIIIKLARIRKKNVLKLTTSKLSKVRQFRKPNRTILTNNRLIWRKIGNISKLNNKVFIVRVRKQPLKKRYIELLVKRGKLNE